MKSKLKLIFSAMMVSNLLLINLILFLPKLAGAQVNNVPPANNTPVVPYSGPEASIRRFLCVPNISDNKTSTKPDVGTVTSTATNNPSAGDLATCVNRLYRFAGAIGAFAAVFFVALAGYYYILGGEKAKEKAKHMIISVIAGLVIIFTAFILLKQINPEAVKFKTIQPPQLGKVGNFPDCASLLGNAEQNCLLNGKIVSSNGSGGGIAYSSCSGGQVAVTGVAANGGLQICQDLLTKLQAMKKITDAQSVKWTVAHTTDNPDGHDSSCHKTGTATQGQCADVVVSGGKWAEACTAAKQVGISILNEATATRGTSAENACGPYIKSDQASANPSNDHLHLYLGS
jgi:hypothetical protein